MQEILDRYRTGIGVVRVTMQNAQPPEQVQAAFEDTLKAGQDGDRLKKEGLAYASDVIPKAQGTSARLREEAEQALQSFAERVAMHHHVDHAVLHQMAAGIVDNERMRHAVRAHARGEAERRDIRVVARDGSAAGEPAAPLCVAPA